MKTIFGLLLGLILLSSTAAPSFAQRDSSRAEMKIQLMQLMKEKLVDKVGLSESTADRFISEMDANRDEMRSLSREKRELMEDIDLDPGSADVETKIDRILDIDIQIAEMKKSFKNKLREFMSAQEIAKTMKFRKNFDKQLRKEIKRKKNRDDGPGDRPGKGPGPPDDDF